MAATMLRSIILVEVHQCHFLQIQICINFAGNIVRFQFDLYSKTLNANLHSISISNVITNYSLSYFEFWFLFI